MSNILELNCWVLGDDPRSVFPVEVAISKTGYMRKAILPEMEKSCDDLVAKSLTLWKVNINLTMDSDLLKSIKVEGDIPEGEELKPWDPLSKVSTCGPEVGNLHIVVKRPAGTCKCFSTTQRCKTNAPSQPLDTESPLDLIRALRQLYVQNFPNTAPSSQGVPSEFAQLQQDEQHTIRWNCPPLAASSIPPTLLHPIFGKFIDDCENYEPTAADNKLVWTLSAAMSSFFKDEAGRASKFREILQDSGIDISAAKIEGL